MVVNGPGQRVEEYARDGVAILRLWRSPLEYRMWMSVTGYGSRTKGPYSPLGDKKVVKK
jgi:hypothetical protein